MVHAVQASVTFRNVARRDAVADQISQRLAAEVPWGETTVSFGSGDGGPSLYVEVRFSTEAEADAFWNDIQAAFGVGPNGPVAGSRMWRHACPHDEDVGECAVGEEVIF